MAKKYAKSLFVFRRDLRTADNTGFIAACRESEKVIPCFIFDSRQVGAANKYRSHNAIQFMAESLKDLDDQLKKKGGKLYLFNGIAEKVVANLLKKESCDAVYLNADYTPFSLKRDKAIERIVHRAKAEFYSFHDVLLQEPELVKTQGGTPYGVYSAFYKKAVKIPVPTPKKLPKVSLYKGSITGSIGSGWFKDLVKKENKELYVHGGTGEAQKIVRRISRFKNYAKERDFPAIDTTLLSAHLKFGTVSVREVFHAVAKKLGKSHPLLRQLYWRDFWTYVAYHSPFVYGQAYHKKYNKLWWHKGKKPFNAWCKGKIGFPIVDAGMRQLNQTGFMHNRVRMIVASFLTKDLHTSWLWGEKYFAQQLVDYDPAVNNGNWQWSASTGCDSQPYFRIFNPWLQQKKFDPDCAYIKQWIPELKDVEPKIIHNWFKESAPKVKGYPRPIVDHKIETKRALVIYKKV